MATTKKLPRTRGTKKSGTKPASEGTKDADVNSMGPEEWEKAVAHAEKQGGPLHAELVRLARRFDDGTGVGHGVATSLTIVGLAGRSARTCLEVQFIASRWIDDLAGIVVDARMGQAGGAS